jgi:predicted enzyme involved in methoxymalonyl-ACP biosynthesis
VERLKTAGNGGASAASDQFEIIHLNTALKISCAYKILVVHNIETTRWKYSQNILERRTNLTRPQVHVNLRLKDLTLLIRETEHIMLHRPLRISIKLLKHCMLFNIEKYAFSRVLYLYFIRL